MELKLSVQDWPKDEPRITLRMAGFAAVSLTVQEFQDMLNMIGGSLNEGHQEILLNFGNHRMEALRFPKLLDQEEYENWVTNYQFPDAPSEGAS